MAALHRADNRPLAIAVMGPTAAGKTAFAAAWAERLGSAIISVDSAMVYRRMNIGTAKPDAATLKRAPHRLIDIREPHEPYSAADFGADAVIALMELAAAGRVPLLVGGTGLYFKALLTGLAELPASDPDTRNALQRELLERGLSSLHADLVRIDPEAGARIRPADRQRILRALEVFRLTGVPISVWHARGPAAPARFPFRLLKLVLAPADRDLLHRRIALRFRQMLEAGFVDEVRSLHGDPRLHPDLPSMRAVGYRQAWRYLEGECSERDFIDQAIAATRQLAKRQTTWFGSLVDAVWFDPEKDLGALDRATAAFIGGAPPLSPFA